MTTRLLLAGLEALRDYIGLHVLTCLVPAFLLAGALVSFIRREAILRYLGSDASRLGSFVLAGVASFFVAACSCTVIPVASGIYYAGATVGAAFVVLWVAPAANILALVYTGAILGQEMMIARLAGALAMAIVVGSVMNVLFQREEPPRTTSFDEGATGQAVSTRDLGLLLLIAGNLLAPNYLIRSGPYLHKVYVWAAGMAAVALYAAIFESRPEIARWLGETWWFVRLIFPLLLAGVFAVGVLGELLPEPWVQARLGGSGLGASFLATAIGAVSYFATMTEAPFVDKLLRLGMGRGPALALLLTGPGLSLPNWLAIARVFGFRKAAVYVATIVVLGTVAGWFAGNFVFSP